jgi:hypothetical protein
MVGDPSAERVHPFPPQLACAGSREDRLLPGSPLDQQMDPQFARGAEQRQTLLDRAVNPVGLGLSSLPAFLILPLLRLAAARPRFVPPRISLGQYVLIQLGGKSTPRLARTCPRGVSRRRCMRNAGSAPQTLNPLGGSLCFETFVGLCGGSSIRIFRSRLLVPGPSAGCRCHLAPLRALASSSISVHGWDTRGRFGHRLNETVKLWKYPEAMKNITISIDDELYRQARIKAAEQSTSISALFRNFLIRLTLGDSGETEFQRLAREEQELRAELRARRLGMKPEHNLSRDELHDRDALR